MNFKRIRKNLPDAYQEVEYIQTDGAAYINMGYVPKINDVYTVKFSEQSGTENAVVFGSRSSGTYSTSTNQVYLNLSGGVQGDEIRFYQGVNYTLLQSREVDTLIELTLSVTSDGGYDNHATQPLYLFVMNNSGTATAQSSQSLIKIYGFSVTNGSLKHSFVPCYRKSDNAIGMYDIVTDSFFVNSGTGAFIKGGNVTNNVWHDTPHYIHNTSTDTITTLPAVLYPTGTTATVGLKGQTTQSSIPSPASPVMPQGTGERTRNLADLYNVNSTKLNLTFTTGNNMTVVINGTKVDGANVIPIAKPNVILPAGTYTVTIKMISGSITNTSEGAFWGINGSTYAQRTTPNVKEIGDVGKRTFTLSEDTLLSSLDITPSYSNAGSVWNDATFECMLYSGSDDIPYEPYGYKIPISSANTTTPVYLGEVETTRKIKKLVLTGKESWNTYQSTYYTTVSDYYRMYDIGSHLSVCSHYPNIQAINLPEMHYCLGGLVDGSTHTVWNGNIVFNPSPMISSLTDWRAFLAQQYAAGTPVTVWYVLAEPTTGVVNEPIRKIGTYTDEVSGITIPTITGKDTFDVLTTLKPSEVNLTYTGWHDATVEEWDGSQWQ